MNISKNNTPLLERPYRSCVGLMVFNRDGNVFCGQRLDNKAEAWQLPQGVMIVVSGNTVRQVTAMANNLTKKYKDMGLRLPSPEGMSNGDWVLIDAKDVLVHIFRPEVRDFYSLEKMWIKKQEEMSPDALEK